LFAALNVALSDAAIVCWDAKYRYNWWRTITAIRAADTDGNPVAIPVPTTILPLSSFMVSGEPLTHEEVMVAGAEAGPRLARVIRRFLADLADD